MNIFKKNNEKKTTQKLPMTGGCIVIRRITLWTATMALKMRS